MWNARFGKIMSVCIIFGFITLNFWASALFDSFGSAEQSSYQPYNAFVRTYAGGSSEQLNAKYGWNLTYINDFNDDGIVDLVISAPWFDLDIAQDIGAIFIFYGKPGILFKDLNQSASDVVITGEIDGDNFGWSVADAGDVNHDGITDILVGAPGALLKRGKAYVIYGGKIKSGTYNVKNLKTRVLNSQTIGIPSNGGYGTSVAGIGDMNNDGYDDIVVGAPGADMVILTYGYKNKVKLYPNIWDDDPVSKDVVTFDKGVNNTILDSNTWGLAGEDDGWDWIDSFADPTELYGRTTPAIYDHANIYAPWESNGSDAQGMTLGNRSALEIMIGRNHTHLNPYGDGWDWDPAASAAWGIEFQITDELYEYLSANSTISIGFDYEAFDASRIYNNSNLSRNFIYTLRSRIWNSTDKYYLGDEVVNGETYIYYKQDTWNVPPWGPILGSFDCDISDYIDGPGSYYWDFGGYFERSWSTRYDDGLIAFFDNITMSIKNDRDVIIQGMHNSGLGTSIAALGDINNDGYPDILVGAPNNYEGHAVLIYGKKKFNNVESINFGMIITGIEQGDKFGYAIANAGDVDNDGISDIIIGAPGGSYAHLYYSSTLASGLFTPDLWEKDEDKNTPFIEFDSGLKTEGNTPGITGKDDGWDVWNGVYGYQAGATPGSSVKFNGADGTDPDQVNIDNELIIAIGGGLGGGSTVGAKPDSGAYGVKFKLTDDMVSALALGGKAILTYDWYFENVGLDQDETVWIKTYIRDSTTNYDLGWDLDSDAGLAENKDDTNEVFWADVPYSVKSSFIQDCTFAFSNAGYYYLDIGAKVRDYWWENSAWEDGVFHFDNIYLRIIPPPDISFVGQVNSSFGFAVGSANKLNIDTRGDIVIGAPKYNSANGEQSGAVFGFIIGQDGQNDKNRLAESAEFVRYGERAGDNFGWAVLGTKSIDSDEFSEVIASAINYDSTMIDSGKVYLLSISKGPRIRVVHPIGGEIFTGEVTLKATVRDPDNNIDNSLGVFFYYSKGNSDWISIGNVLTPVNDGNQYELTWNTTSLADGTDYQIRGWVQDMMLNKGENITGYISIDNVHRPVIEIKTPKENDIINGIAEITAKVKDSELDIIHGGINTEIGVQFYFSTDNENWSHIGTKNIGADDKYTILFDTTDYPDGKYWFKVQAVDLDGFELEKEFSVQIDNPARKPSIELLYPLNVSELSGVISLKASAFDYDGDINSSGVSFFISKQTEPENWVCIGNDPEPELTTSGRYIYSYSWDTSTITDYWYKLKAEVNDSSGLNNISAIEQFTIHNHKNNPPYIKLVSPTSGNVDSTEIITAYVQDLEDNVAVNGVDYYYSSDKVTWRYLGSTQEPRVGNDEYYDFIWQTDTIPDGMYWLNVSVTDETNLRTWSVSEDTVFVHNSDNNPPRLDILAPVKKQHINGTFTIQVLAIDLENNINSIGVRLYYSKDGKDWTVISNIPTPSKTNKGVYELAWDTLKYSDGTYWLKAEAFDFTELKGEDTINCFIIHNKYDNTPIVRITKIIDSELSGTVVLNATVFDLENNIDADGVKFYYSADNKTWYLISSDPSGNPVDELKNYYEIYWDTTNIHDGKYWLKAEATDLTGKIGKTYFSKQVIIHNKNDNPPIITLKQPQTEIPLAKIQSIIVNVFDFESDVESVLFFYSKDKNNWKLIDTIYASSNNEIYMTRWDTGQIKNGNYYLKIVAVDKYGNQEQLTAGPFVVTTGIDRDANKDGGNIDWLWIVVVLICIVIVIILVFAVLRRSKKREEELIEEVSNEMIRSMSMEGEVIDNRDHGNNNNFEIVNNSNTELYSALSSKPIGPPQGQSNEPTDYEPDVNTIEFYKQQVSSWKAEGYNVSYLEGLSNTDEVMFAREFPMVSSNITRLKNISNKLNSMDTVGYKSEFQAIKEKLFEPDYAAQVELEFQTLESKQNFTPNPNPTLVSQYGDKPTLPNKPSYNIPRVAPVMESSFSQTSASEPVRPIGEQVQVQAEFIELQDGFPNDIELSLPLEPEEEFTAELPPPDYVDFPDSPFADAQVQSLEDELDGDAEIIELDEN